MEHVEAELTFLLRSEARRTVLVALDVEEALGRNEIEESLDASRRTVSRVLGTLVEEGYVQNRGNRYRLTAYGAFAIEVYRNRRPGRGVPAVINRRSASLTATTAWKTPASAVGS